MEEEKRKSGKKDFKAKTLEDEPSLGPHLLWVWQAFVDLNYRRPVSMGGPLPIPYSEIDAYARLKGIFLARELQRLTRFVGALDREYMSGIAEQQKQEEAKSKRNPPPSHSPPRGGGVRRPTRPMR